MASDYKDGHEEGDVGATGKGWQEMNCYLEATASQFTSSFKSGTSIHFEFDFKVEFQKSKPAFLVLADSPDIVRFLVLLPDSPGSSPGGFSPSLHLCLLLIGFRLILYPSPSPTFPLNYVSPFSFFRKEVLF